MMGDVDGNLCNIGNKNSGGEGQISTGIYAYTRVVAAMSRVLLIIGVNVRDLLFEKHGEAEAETSPRQGLRRDKEL